MAKRVNTDRCPQDPSKPIVQRPCHMYQQKVAADKAVEEAKRYIRLQSDKDGCEVKEVNDFIGKGVFANKDYLKGEFILYYDGELISLSEGELREETYPDDLGSFLYFFSVHGKKFCIDATFSKRMARYVNDAARHELLCNAQMLKLFVDNRPVLALFARRFILAGEEIRYDYGVADLSWRCQTDSNVSDIDNDSENDQDILKLKPCNVVLQRLPLSALKAYTETWGERDLKCKDFQTPDVDLLKLYEEKDTEKRDLECKDLQTPEVDLLTSYQEKASLDVDRIWSQSETTDFIIGTVHGINITDRDIRSLQGEQWLTDQVIDGYLRLLCQGEIDKGKLTMHVPVQTMTSICTGKYSTMDNIPKVLSKHILTNYHTIVGVCHMRGSHWTLVVLEPGKGDFYLFDSMGFSEEKANKSLNHWREFLNKRQLERKVPWRLCHKEISIQKDSYNCGMFSLMFAERFLAGQPLTAITLHDLQQRRRDVAEKLLQYEVFFKNACPCCGHQIFNEEKISCISCGRLFHKKSYCVGEENITKEIVNILCRGCNQKIVVCIQQDTLPSR